MKKYILLIILFLFVTIVSCQEKEVKQKIIMNKSRANTEYNLLSVLEKQLKDGYYEGHFETPDLEALLFIEDSLLANQGYKKPTEQEFKDRLKLIFNLKLDNLINISSPYIINSDSSCIKFNPAIFKNYEDENTGDEYYRYVYVTIVNRFITPLFWLPEIIDYKKVPNLTDVEIEKDRDTRYWKDIDDVPKKRRFNKQLLISRNKYLFNDDKSQFVWLTYNDEDFMESLVKTFGYTEDKKLLKWAFDKQNFPRYMSKYSRKEKLEEFEKFLWTKQCNGNIQIHENTLNLLKELSTPENSDYILHIASYINYLVYSDSSKLLYNDSVVKNINFAQKTKIIAYLLNFGEQYRYDKQYDFNQMFMGHFWHYIDNGSYYKEFEKNNFYGLPNLKKWYDISKKERDIFKDNEELPDSPQPLDYQDKVGVWEGFL